METQNKSTYAFISTTSTTFHPENPLENAIIDNPGLVRRRRRKTSARELEVLEMAFRECEKPSREVREEIARKTGMDGKAVQVSLPSLRDDVDDRFGFRIDDNRHDVHRRPCKPIKRILFLWATLCLWLHLFNSGSIPTFRINHPLLPLLEFPSP